MQGCAARASAGFSAPQGGPDKSITSPERWHWRATLRSRRWGHSACWRDRTGFTIGGREIARRDTSLRVGANALKTSLPGLIRQSISFERTSCEDGWMPGSSPGTSVFACTAISISNSKLVSSHSFAISPRIPREFCWKSPALSRQGRRECRAPDAPDSRVCNGRKWKALALVRSHRNHPAFPAQWFYGLFRALPGDRALLPPSPAEVAFRELDASVGASGPHVFAVRFMCSRQLHHRRPPHPAPRP